MYHFSGDKSSLEVGNSKHDIKTSGVAEAAPLPSAVKENIQVEQWKNQVSGFLSIYCKGVSKFEKFCCVFSNYPVSLNSFGIKSA